MPKTFMQYQSPMDILLWTKDDCYDTMEWCGKIQPLLVEAACAATDPDSPDLKTITKISDLGVSEGVYQIPVNGIIFNLQVFHGFVTTTDQINPDHGWQVADIVDGKLHIVNDLIKAEGRSDTISFEELLFHVSNTYSTNAVLYNACDLLSKGAYSASELSARCSINGTYLTGDSLEMMNNITAVTNNEVPNSIIPVISGLYGAISGAVVNDNAIEFAKNDFFVKSFVSSVYVDVIGGAATILGLLIANVNPILGLLLSLTGVAIHSIGQLVSSTISTDAKLNFDSNYRIYAQPIMQYEWIGTGVQTETPPDYTTTFHFEPFVKFLYEKGTYKFITKGYVAFFWVAKLGSSYADATYRCEVFLNLIMKNIERATGVESEFGVEELAIRNELYSGPALGDYTIVVHPYSVLRYNDDSNPERNADFMASYNYIDIDSSETDSQLRRRIVTSIAYTLANLIATGGLMDNGSYDYTYSNSNTIWSTNSDLREKSRRVFFCVNRAISWDVSGGDLQIGWSTIVNETIPALQALMPAWRYNLFTSVTNYLKLLKILNGDQQQYSSVDVNAVTGYSGFVMKNDFFLVPPSYSRTALVLTAFAGLAVTAIAATSIWKVTYAIKSRLSYVAASRYSAARQAYDNFNRNPTYANYVSYYESMRKYNRFANLTSGTIIDPSTGKAIGLGDSTIERVSIAKVSDGVDQIKSLIVK